MKELCTPGLDEVYAKPKVREVFSAFLSSWLPDSGLCQTYKKGIPLMKEE